MTMRRNSHLAVIAGFAVAVILLAAGGLLIWGSTYVHNTVQGQLAAQQIFFPPKAAFAHQKAGTEITPSMIPSVSQYAGQQLLTGQQAEVWSNDFMAVHLYNMPYHGVYANVSAAARATPTNKALAALEQTSFQGTTLRGLLLEAYAFSKTGQIMLWGAIASFVLAFVLAILVGLGFWHAARTPEEARLLSQDGRLPSPGAKAGAAPRP